MRERSLTDERDAAAAAMSVHAQEGLAAVVDAAVDRLDRARAATLALALRAGLGPLLARRDRRLAVLASAGMLVALALTIVAPVALFVVGPLLLGVPHVASDLRYLVLRRGLSARFTAATALACATIFALRVAIVAGVGQGPLPQIELALAAAWILASMLAGAVTGGSPARLFIALPLLGLVTVAALLHPTLAGYVFVHGHNLVAVALWVALFRRASQHRRLAAPVAVMGIAWTTTLLVAGVTLRWTYYHGVWRSFGYDLGDLSQWLAPGLSPRLGAGVAASYIFLQAVHYGVWLGWIPQDDTRAEGTVTFRMSARALRRDFGVAGLALIALAMVAVLVGALLDPARTRDVYVSLAMFHAYLELAMLGYFAVRGRLTVAGAS